MNVEPITLFKLAALLPRRWLLPSSTQETLWNCFWVPMATVCCTRRLCMPYRRAWATSWAEGLGEELWRCTSESLSPVREVAKKSSVPKTEFEQLDLCVELRDLF